MITEVQGHISDEEMTRQAQLIPPIQRSEPGAPPRHKIVHYNGGVHVVLLVFILLAAILSVIQVVAGDEAVGWILTLAIMAQFGISIAAAARQSGTDIPSGLRLVVWTAFGQTLALPLLFIFASAATITLTFEPGGAERREMIFDGILMASAIVSGVLSILGRHLLVSFRDKYAYKRMAARARTQTLDQTEI